MSYVAEQVDAMIRDRGMPATLSRASEVSTISLYAKRYGSADVDLEGGSAQQQFRVKIGTAAILASAWSSKIPARGDKLLIGGRTRSVLDVDTREDAGATAMHILTVAG